MNNKIGQFLKTARLAVGLTQDAAAKSAGMSRQQVNRIENGESGTEWDTVERLVIACGADKAEAVRIFTATEDVRPDVRLARQIEPYLTRVPLNKRPQAEQMIVDMARHLPELFAA